MNPQIKSLIKENSNLFWYTPNDKKEEISMELFVETMLNYGSLEDIKRTIKILGIKEMSRIFLSAKGRKKLNYYPEIYNYFSIYFSRYA